MSEHDTTAQEAPVNRPAINHDKIARLIEETGLSVAAQRVIGQILGEFGYVVPGSQPGGVLQTGPRAGEIWVQTNEMTTPARRNAYFAANKLVQINGPNAATYVSTGENCPDVFTQHGRFFQRYASSMEEARRKLTSPDPLGGITINVR